MWKVEIWFSLSFVGYVSSDSLNLSIQLAILHPWMFLQSYLILPAIEFLISGVKLFQVHYCCSFLASWIHCRKDCICSMIFLLCFSTFLSCYLQLRARWLNVGLFIVVFMNKLKYLIGSLFCRSIGHLEWRREQTPALKTSLHLTSLLPGGQWKSYMMLAKPVQLVWVTSHQRSWGTCLL